MNDCLQLPVRQGLGGMRRLGAWEACWMSLGEGEQEGFASGGGHGWEGAAVPEQRWAAEGRSAVWYRTRFPRPDHDGRVVLRVGGAFLGTNVWINGRLLGSHYGYFAPFGFDVTPYLREQNLVAICCESPIETDLPRKRHVMGIFNDGDCRPYPSSAWFSLPEPYRWQVPVGLWQPVELEYTGAVVLESLRVRPAIEAGDVGRVEVTAQLRNLDGREMPGEIVLELEEPREGEGRSSPPLRLRRTFTMAGGSERAVRMLLTVPRARRWAPWRLGGQPLYRVVANVLVRDRHSVRWEDTFGFRDVVVEAGAEGWEVTASGRPLFMRGANYVPSLRLDRLDADSLAGDLRLAKQANLDLLRVHGHVLPQAFYRLADEAGMLVVADFPLTLSYAYHASAEETKFFEHGVRAQVPEMVAMLCNRPSVVLWVAHDDPPWIGSSAPLGDVHAVRQNYTIDQEVKATIEQLDPTRTVLAASGDLDQHLWLGWREGSWHHFGDVLPGFVTEFGAQSLPGLDSPDWEALGRRWPVPADDPAWLYAGYEAAAWSEHGVGLPGDYESLAEYVEASQEYQAWLLSYAIDQLRKRKFERCWGAVVFALTDSFAGVGFGLVDFSRRPRPALEAVQEAFAPLRLIVDPVGFVPLVPFGVGWRPDDEITVRLVVVNDDPAVEGEGEIRWSVVRDTPLSRGPLRRVLDSMRRKSSGGTVPLALPTATDPALQVASFDLPIDAEGDYTFEAELRVPGREPQTTELLFRIADRLETVRRRSLLPGYLAERIAVAGSLRQVAGGIQFRLRNRTRPALLTALGGVRLDGDQVPEPRLVLEADGGRVPVPSELEMPVDRDVVILLETRRRLEPGEHELEVDLTLPGIASGRVRVRGRIPEHSG